jgi:two-component system osmolarity sensor histidine kinase EnvZ
MLRRLFSRNVAMLIGVVLAGQLLAGLLVQIWVIGPQTTRVADVTADMIHALSTTVGNLPAERRAAVIADLSDGSRLLIRPVSDPPTDGQRFPTFIEYRFMRALAARLTTQHKLDWITDTRGRLWIRLALGPDDYWVSVTPPRRRSAMTSLLAALAAVPVIPLSLGYMRK